MDAFDVSLMKLQTKLFTCLMQLIELRLYEFHVVSSWTRYSMWLCLICLLSRTNALAFCVLGFGEGCWFRSMAMMS